MERKKIIEKLKSISSDIKNGTSYSIKHLSSNNVEDTISKEGIKRRKLFAPIMRAAYKTQSKYKLVVDSRTKISDNPNGHIYILNHRQSDDIVLGVNAVDDSGYLLFGNPTLVYETANGLGLWAYGMILLERNNPESRKSSYDKMKYVLENGGNIILWSEGYWNLDDNGQKDERHEADDHNSENWLVQDINVGAIRLAKETGASIVPTVLHYDEINEKMCYAIRGEEILVDKSDNIMGKKDEIVDYMTTLYYYLMSKYSTYKRSELEKSGITLKEQWELLKQELVADCDIPRIDYKLDLSDEKFIGKAKVSIPVTTNEEAFEHLGEINYNYDNVFLLSKGLSGKK